jgi:hypothetical protein
VRCCVSMGFPCASADMEFAKTESSWCRARCFSAPAPTQNLTFLIPPLDWAHAKVQSRLMRCRGITRYADVTPVQRQLVLGVHRNMAPGKGDHIACARWVSSTAMVPVLVHFISPGRRKTKASLPIDRHCYLITLWTPDHARSPKHRACPAKKTLTCTMPTSSVVGPSLGRERRRFSKGLCSSRILLYAISVRWPWLPFHFDVWCGLRRRTDQLPSGQPHVTRRWLFSHSPSSVSNGHQCRPARHASGDITEYHHAM